MWPMPNTETPTRPRTVSAQLAALLRQAQKNRAAGTITCRPCNLTFADGYSWLNHHTKDLGDVDCGDRSMLAAYGFVVSGDGVWRKA